MKVITFAAISVSFSFFKEKMKRELGENPKQSRCCNLQNRWNTTRHCALCMGRHPLRGVSQKTCRIVIMLPAFEERAEYTFRYSLYLKKVHLLSLVKELAIDLFIKMRKMHRIVLLLIAIVLCPFCMYGEDSIPLFLLPSIEVEASSEATATASLLPVQSFSADALQEMNALQLSDAVKHFSGVTVKDYGGVGGMKTVSIRSLGAIHTAVSYDGITMNDCQSGQMDIGRFSLTNVQTLSLTVGQNETIFQPAKLFASAGVLSIQTHEPVFENNKKMQWTMGMKGGSWNYFSPSLLFSRKVTDRMSISLNGDYRRTDGNYSYMQQNGAYSLEKRRKNSDVDQLQGELNLYYNLPLGGDLKVKGYGYRSKRGLPGSVLLYTDNKEQRLYDKNVFIQTRYEQPLGDYSLLVNGKYNYTWNRYTSVDPALVEGKSDDRYTQREAYLSVAARRTFSDYWEASVATDYTYNYLFTNYEISGSPSRHTSQSVAALCFENDWFTGMGSMLFTSVNEKLNGKKGGEDFIRLSPTLSFSFSPGWRPLRVRLMYKDIFRAPTFNDLYYERTGNRSLAPEKTKQYNLGITYLQKTMKMFSNISLTVDCYYNQIEDKIVTVPRGNMFNWSVLNYGEVAIKGMDVVMDAEVALTAKHVFQFTAGYTFQQAEDCTDATIPSYHNQLPYTPKHSWNGHLSYHSPWFVLSYNIIGTGLRYYERQNKDTNRLSGYNEQSMSISRLFKWKNSSLKWQVECLNLFDSNYELVRNFPMPGRSFHVSIVYNY